MRFGIERIEELMQKHNPRVMVFAKAKAFSENENNGWAYPAIGFAMDLGTNGIPGNGYNTKFGDMRYFVKYRPEYDDFLLWNISRDGSFGVYDVEEIGERIVNPHWEKPTKCGCVTK